MSENHSALVKELGDLQAMIEIMYEFQVVNCTIDQKFENIFKKRQKLKKFSRIFEEL